MSIHLSIHPSIHLHICMYVCMYIYPHIYIYVAHVKSGCVEPSSVTLGRKSEVPPNRTLQQPYAVGPVVIYLSIHLDIHLYICTYVCMFIYIYIYIYIAHVKSGSVEPSGVTLRRKSEVYA